MRFFSFVFVFLFLWRREERAASRALRSVAKPRFFEFVKFILRPQKGHNKNKGRTQETQPPADHAADFAQSTCLQSLEPSIRHYPASQTIFLAEILHPTRRHKNVAKQEFPIKPNHFATLFPHLTQALFPKCLKVIRPTAPLATTSIACHEKPKRTLPVSSVHMTRPRSR